jgi:predicted ArsR family transcriptional regulator
LEIDLQKDFLETTRGQIVTVLRRGASTVEGIASQLQLSHNAVRVQLTRMQRDGLVRRASVERRSTRPSHVFELTPAAQQLLSRAYVPFLLHVVRLLSAGHSRAEFKNLMRNAGRSLAENYGKGVPREATLAGRARAASNLLNLEFGALTEVERMNGRLVIQGHGCPLAAVTGGQPAVCVAMETFVQEVVGTPVKECCTRRHPPQCCFELGAVESGRKRKGT